MSKKTYRKQGRPPGAKNKKGIGDRVIVTVTLSKECVDFLNINREAGYIKGRLIESALRKVYKF